METVSISKLKAHLSAEIKKVRQGATLIVMDRNHPVAKIVPVETELYPLEMIDATRKFECQTYPPILEKGSIMRTLEEERADRC